MALELIDLAPGLWIWRQEHPAWTPGSGWKPAVTSTCVESGGEIEAFIRQHQGKDRP